MSIREELGKGLKQTFPYLLSHHKPEDYYRCHTLSFKNRELNFCARCTGIYPGILAGIIQIFHLQIIPILWITALLGIPTLIEKYFTSIKDYKGYNNIRTLTGILLGIAYINGTYILAQNPFKPEILLTALFYLIGASWLILQQRQKGQTPN